MIVKVKRLTHAHDLDLPARATPGSAGRDLRAAVTEPLTLAAGRHALVPTGLVFELPPGTEGQVRPRSGLAVRYGVTVLNSPGTVDCDYRGEIRVLLVNHGDQDFVIERGMRIAQMVVAPVATFDWLEVEELSDTERGESGFGSSGISS